MALVWPNKDPDEVLDYDLYWTERLGDGDSIVTSTWEVAEGDVVIDSDEVASPVTKVWLSGGTIGTTCVLTNRITTVPVGSNVRTMDQSVKFKIKAK